jgi:translation initiation factor IF-1
VAKQEDKLTLEGKVIEALPNTTFRVKLENGYEVLAYLSGRIVYRHRSATGPT